MMKPRSAATPAFRKPYEVRGSRLRFRDATPRDAEFVLSLRLDPLKNEHLSPTNPDVAEQRRWLKRYQGDSSQVYFIIEDAAGRPVGTVRLYDAQGLSFCWGSWVLSDQAPKSSAIESSVMVYAFGLACGFTAAHFDVRRANERVWQYHERAGAARVRQDELSYFYKMDEPAIRGFLERYSSRVPEGIEIAWV